MTIILTWQIIVEGEVVCIFVLAELWVEFVDVFDDNSNGSAVRERGFTLISGYDSYLKSIVVLEKKKKKKNEKTIIVITINNRRLDFHP